MKHIPNNTCILCLNPVKTRHDLCADTSQGWSVKPLTARNINKAVERDPLNHLALFDHARMEFIYRGGVAALGDLNKLIELMPEHSPYYGARGKALLEADEYQKALLDFNRAIELNPSDYWSYNNRGIARMMMGQYAEALEDFCEVLRHDPDDVVALHNRGVCRYKTSSKESFVDDFERSLRLLPPFSLDPVEQNRIQIVVNAARAEGGSFFQPVRNKQKMN